MRITRVSKEEFSVELKGVIGNDQIKVVNFSSGVRELHDGKKADLFIFGSPLSIHIYDTEVFFLGQDVNKSLAVSTECLELIRMIQSGELCEYIPQYENLVESFKVMLERHDWNYLYSDDSRIYLNGINSLNAIHDFMRENDLMCSGELSDLYYAYKNINNSLSRN